MEILAFAIPSMCGALAAWIVDSQPVKFWIVLVTVWLSVPLGIASSLGLGIWLKHLGNCYDPRGRDIAECLVLGIDISDWVNGLKMSGYAIALVGLPWFLAGALLVAIILIVRVLRAVSQ